MSKLQDFLDREQLMAERQTLKAKQGLIVNEIARLDSRLRNAFDVQDVVNGVMLNRGREAVGVDRASVSAIFEDEKPRFAECYWSRKDAQQWLVKVGTGAPAFAAYDVLGTKTHQFWDQGTAMNVAWNWLIYGRKDDVTPFVIEGGA